VPRSDPTADDELPSLTTALRRRLRLLASGVVVGAPAGPAAVGVFVAAGRRLPDAVAAGFALGTLALGFGVLGWSGSILAGPGIDAARDHLAVGSDWTETGSRRAMTRIVGLGVGAMATTSLVETVA
jgi:hypothetical protein